MQRLLYIFAFVSMLLFVACESGSGVVDLSTEARVNTFTFYSDTLNPGLTEVVFKVEHRTWPDTGRIYCEDSLRFGTCLDSVVPYVTYKASPSSAIFVTPDTILVSTGVDTLNFSRAPIYLFVQAADTAYKRCYRVDIHVHQADPELFVWKQMTSQLFAPAAAPAYCNMKAVYSNGQIFLFVNNGFSIQLYQSTDGALWNSLGAPIGLPSSCQVRDILQHNGRLYYAAGDGEIYSTDNMVNWTTVDFSNKDYVVLNMLVSFDHKAWCVLQERDSTALSLGVLHNGDVMPVTSIFGLTNGVLPDNFPVSDFAALSFESSSERPRAMIVGGRTIDGTAVNTRWNLEYEASEGYRIVDFSIEQPSFNSLTGMSIIQYNNQLLMFGGVDNDLEWRSNMLYSEDEGMNWYVPDSAHNRLPDTYGTRQNQTVVVDDNQNIYIIGGQSFLGSYSDVYRGFLNKLKWTINE